MKHPKQNLPSLTSFWYNFLPEKGFGACSNLLLVLLGNQVQKPSFSSKAVVRPWLLTCVFKLYWTVIYAPPLKQAK